jgi:hypothetical protein
MQNFEVPEPIINSPYEEPKEHWYPQSWEGDQPKDKARLTSFLPTKTIVGLFVSAFIRRSA